MKKVKYILGCAATIAMLATACSKIEEVPGDTADKPKFTDKSKVLVIVVDGLAGKQVKAVAPPVITQMLAHSTYSYDTRADTVTTDGASLATLYTGVPYAKNEIRDSSLVARSTSGARYAPFLSLIKKTGKRALKTISVTAWDAVNKTLLADATTKVTTKDDDKAVLDSAVNRLKNDSLDLMFVQFNGINKAGKQYGYYSYIPEYAAAINQVDAYIGELLKTINSRPDYQNENWLVIVQSTHGGLDKSYGSDSDAEMNSFSLYYCPDLFRYQIDQPQTIPASIKFNEQNEKTVNAVLNDATAYNFGAPSSANQFTVECKVKTPKGSNPTYPGFLSKRASFAAGQVGWTFFQEGSYWMINLSGTGATKNLQAKGADINDGNWHHLTCVFATKANNVRVCSTYTDGKYNNAVTVTEFGNLNSTAPLTIGFIPGSINTPVTIYMADVRIWNDTLPAATIAAFSCTNVLDQHPYLSKLVGWWPVNERKGNVLRNAVPAAAGKDFKVNGTFTWEAMNYVLPCAGNADKQNPPNNTDLCYQIAYWLNLDLNPDWEIGGRLWLKFF
ncbi:Type I phosphodiesterase / nucleotide pyrophosphatase [Chitinophaga jiangningensis]|uniref:Type I phosphodiesterase / nucleotide pyrophosphatase n=1 Tax=Chitinophaga jiangningensis TaxID=1419482 RepID=A0A1M7BT86_9BACT|nr:LamG-like jellyroll fold domain-containing protein [Chitinophaga jiangningensis]SHL58076.1 Type I phosphodiesterase / nucleotide pyrophosphatase [Chitinophaga jiangningensis]